MLSYIRNLFDRPSAPASKSAPAQPAPEPDFPQISSALRRPAPDEAGRVRTYSKVFRYRLPAGQTQEPNTVEVIGSFTQWKRVALHRDGKLDAWHITFNQIPINQTHHYMLLVDDVPTYDKGCDGYAIPRGPQEEQYQIMTDQGPRMLMLFAQAK